MESEICFHFKFNWRDIYHILVKGGVFCDSNIWCSLFCSHSWFLLFKSLRVVNTISVVDGVAKCIVFLQLESVNIGGVPVPTNFGIFGVFLHKVSKDTVNGVLCRQRVLWDYFISLLVVYLLLVSWDVMMFWFLQVFTKGKHSFLTHLLDCLACQMWSYIYVRLYPGKITWYWEATLN